MYLCKSGTVHNICQGPAASDSNISTESHRLRAGYVTLESSLERPPASKRTLMIIVNSLQ